MGNQNDQRPETPSLRRKVTMFEAWGESYFLGGGGDGNMTKT